MNRPTKELDSVGVETTTLRAAALALDTPPGEAGEPGSLPRSGGGVSRAPTQVLLAPWGLVESTNGAFVLDEESARLAVEAFQAHGTDLPIDFEHQTLGGSYASPTGQAPAAGWIKRLIPQPGTGLLAEIEWTQQGRELVAGNQYRYLSPVAVIRKADRKLVAIHSAALTNKPAIVGMRPIVNRTRDEGTKGQRDVGVEERLELLRAELQLPGDSGVEEVLVAAAHRIFQLGQEARRRGVAERVREALAAGKLVEAQRAWAEELAARDEASFEEWFRTAPVVVVPGSATAAPPALWSDRRSGTEHPCPGRGHAVATRARAEYRCNPLLRRLTTEEAFVADTVRMQNELHMANSE